MDYSLSQQQVRSQNKQFFLFYFFVFFGFGSLFPLLSVYLKDVIGLSGSQIGTIMSISPVVMIIVQPLWGVLSDVTQKPTYILTVALILTGISGIIFSFLGHYYMIIIIATLLAITQSALVPLSDSIAVNYAQKTNVQYGSIRLWGAVGFALAVLVMGWVSDVTNLVVIFYGFGLTLFIATLFAWRLPKENQTLKVSLKEGFRELVNVPRYFVFLFVAFLVLGPIFANNIYFGILIAEVGGGLTGIGIAFLLAAGSEAPFMKLANKMISKLGLMNIVILATIVSACRWFLYYIDPPLSIIYLSTIAQGFSVGLFIPAAIQYVRDLAPKKVGATAISLYTAIGNGLGNWFCTFVGGLILESLSIMHVYLFFGILTSMAIVVLLWFKLSEQKGYVAS
ncbi:MFS transporter [Bacillus weihaiensis]|uniref:MFS transporter n=1 Tax=Bacillus weihaiensis TaxID=1547283 RepID=UPI002356649B|nr:MFS transporter [Bacillus weihaiensis]